MATSLRRITFICIALCIFSFLFTAFLKNLKPFKKPVNLFCRFLFAGFFATPNAFKPLHIPAEKTGGKHLKQGELLPLEKVKKFVSFAKTHTAGCKALKNHY
jgi:hypothetical protein